ASRLAAAFAADERIAGFLLGEDDLDPRLAPFARLVAPGAIAGGPGVPADLEAQLTRLVTASPRDGGPRALGVPGRPPRAGRPPGGGGRGGARAGARGARRAPPPGGPRKPPPGRRRADPRGAAARPARGRPPGRGHPVGRRGRAPRRRPPRRACGLDRSARRA